MFYCKKCNFQFDCSRQFHQTTTHQQIVNIIDSATGTKITIERKDDGQFYCTLPGCNYRTNNSDTLRQHFKKHQPAAWYCKRCDKYFSCDRKYHLNTVHHMETAVTRVNPHGSVEKIMIPRGPDGLFHCDKPNCTFSALNSENFRKHYKTGHRKASLKSALSGSMETLVEAVNNANMGDYDDYDDDDTNDNNAQHSSYKDVNHGDGKTTEDVTGSASTLVDDDNQSKEEGSATPPETQIQSLPSINKAYHHSTHKSIPYNNTSKASVPAFTYSTSSPTIEDSQSDTNIIKRNSLTTPPSTITSSSPNNNNNNNNSWSSFDMPNLQRAPINILKRPMAGDDTSDFSTPPPISSLVKKPRKTILGVKEMIEPVSPHKKVLGVESLSASMEILASWNRESSP